MSLSEPYVPAGDVAGVKAYWIFDCCVIASVAVVFYDHLITLPLEVELIWGRKFNVVTLLFYLNRWTIFAWAMVQPFGFLSLATLPSCIGYSQLSNILIILLYIIWAVFSAVRIYAISTRSWWLAILVLLLNLVPVASNSYEFFAMTWWLIGELLPDSKPSCISGDNITVSATKKVVIGIRTAVIVADILVLAVTWTRTLAMKRLGDRHSVRTPLTTMLLRDGTAYFLYDPVIRTPNDSARSDVGYSALLILNIVNIVGELTEVFYYTVTTFAPAISSIIITHFLLNLRQAAETGQDDSLPSTASRLTSITFVSFMGNMGEDLDHGFDGAHEPDVTWAEPDPVRETEMGGSLSQS
ncbi:hypothetical protein CERSUDRAFT_124639 [Gelatoporia subvermispora B]|uniref:DUF6533 domain-containing protein n=1 Tax=Ceriporiopsis subvermispora (strain B) TaxID=914234 RepID=M2QTB2_CERS8|nr:hypothetical protein CERSUDRAFT_124639 [Gelatoporia subvermispora B]